VTVVVVVLIYLVFESVTDAEGYCGNSVTPTLSASHIAFIRYLPTYIISKETQT
jgi:hypothetical protein